MVDCFSMQGYSCGPTENAVHSNNTSDDSALISNWFVAPYAFLNNAFLINSRKSTVSSCRAAQNTLCRKNDGGKHDS